jgi:prepilin-type processing-associated H-X9-DG protein
MSRFRNEDPTNFNLWYRTLVFGAASHGSTWPGDLRPQTGAFTLPRINAPPDTTGAVISAVFGGSCGSGNGIPTDWLDPKCFSSVAILGQWAFRSNHPGGVNMAFADGSVKFLKQTINDRAWQSLGTRAGGEVVSADSY